MKNKQIKDLTGKRFGRLKVIKMANYRKGKRIVWTCECDCGNIIDIPGIYLTKKNGTKSCGCISKKHGMFGTRIYNVWHTMKERCYVKSQISYPNYGGRGIKVCDEWQEFIPFMKWSYANGYDENAKRGECTLDRINPDGDYCPENCRWVSMDIQANNKSSNVYIKYNGKIDTLSNHARENGLNPVLVETRKINGKSGSELFAPKREPKTYDYKNGEYTIYEISKLENISVSALANRIKRGESVENAIIEIKKHNKRKIQRNRPVIQYDLYGNFIKKWNNLSEIENKLGYSRGAIGNCCLGNAKTSHGYIWKYE